MDKKTANVVAELVAYDAVPKAKDKETLEAYVKRSYDAFIKKLQSSTNPVIKEVADKLDKPVWNSLIKLPFRQVATANFCELNDPFELEPPKEATVAEILEHNGVKGSEKDLVKIMGQEAFDNYIDKLRTPRKDGLTQTEVNEKREQHYAKYEPLFPSEKTFTHSGNEQATRGYHWSASLKDAFVEDHEAFLSEFGFESEKPEPKEEEKEAGDSK